jgi:hypothetical protein
MGRHLGPDGEEARRPRHRHTGIESMTAAERTKVEAILELEDGLTEWEIAFAEDLARRDDELDGGYDLSERQEEVLTRIYEKKCR